jgi:hypothetical protein
LVDDGDEDRKVDAKLAHEVAERLHRGPAQLGDAGADALETGVLGRDRARRAAVARDLVEHAHRGVHDARRVVGDVEQLRDGKTERARGEKETESESESESER